MKNLFIRMLASLAAFIFVVSLLFSQTVADRINKTISGAVEITTNGASGSPALKLDGTIFTGAGTTNTKPPLLLEPTGTTSTTWVNAGTVFGINTGAGFTGILMYGKVANTDVFYLNANGDFYTAQSISAQTYSPNGTGASYTAWDDGAYIFRNRSKWKSSADGKLEAFNQAGSAPSDIKVGGSQVNVVAVASLPTCNSGAEGMRYGVNNAAALTFGITVTGGGSVHTPVYCDGTNWVVH